MRRSCWITLLPCLDVAKASFLFIHQTRPYPSPPYLSYNDVPLQSHLFHTAICSQQRTNLNFPTPLVALSSTSFYSSNSIEERRIDVEEDSIENFSRDVTKVIKELRPSILDDSIPVPFRRTNPSSLTFGKLWTLDDWNKHTSRWRYIRYVTGLPRSRMLRRILPQLAVLTVWSICAALLRLRNIVVDIPMTSLSLVSTFVAALLTLRSNQGLMRLADCRLAFAKAVLNARDTAQLIVTSVYPKDKQLALIMMRHISLYVWLLKAHMREVIDDDVVRVMLPNTDDANYVLNHRKKPIAVLAKIRQCLASLIARGLLTSSEHLAFERNMAELDEVVMITERIRGAPVPPLYSSHTARLLMVNLFLLPLALTPNVVEKEKLIFVVLTTVLVGFAMFGLDEVSFLLEQPFRLMPLYQLSKVAMMDVADAILNQPPPLPLPPTNGLPP